MRRLIDQLTRTMRYFMEQRDDLLMLIVCSDNDLALPLKVLRDLDRNSPSDLFLLFGDDFLSPDHYLDSIAGRLEEELKLANQATDPTFEKLPPLPGDFLGAGKTAARRLVAGLEYARSLVEPARGQRYLWGMIPGAIKDAKGYLELLAQLPPRPEILPWMRGGRIVARVPADFQIDKSPLAKAKRINVEPFVIPPDVHEKGLLADAADPKLPRDERMQALVQLAYLDYAHSRFGEAREKFRTTLAYFQWAGIPAMQGLIICGFGDIARRQEKWAEAKDWYVRAIPPTVESGNPILLATIVNNLATVAYAEKRFAEAEERYAELVTLKRSTFDEDGLVQALEWRGLSQEKQQAYDRAMPSWEEGALICKAFKLQHRLDPMLTHLKRAYERLDMRDAVKNFDAMWKA